LRDGRQASAGAGVRFIALGIIAMLLLARLFPHPAEAAGCPFASITTREVYLDEASQILTRAGWNRLPSRDRNLNLPRVENSLSGASTADPYVPPALAKAIARIESGWAMADEQTRRGEVGPVLTSWACAYGMMQV